MTSPLEWVAVGLGIINIILLVRRSIWNYPFGIAMVLLYFEVFRESRLYSDMLLQVFFAGVQLWGWAAWRGAGGMDGPVVVTRLSRDARLRWLCGTIVATAGWGWVMHSMTNAAAPWWDAAVAMGSVAAQILLVERKLENWVAWILVDIIAIGLYATRGLTLTAGLYGLFLVMSIAGYVEWRRAEQRRAADAFA